MATINEIQDQIIDDFNLFDEWDEKYAYIIDLGRNFKELIRNLKLKKISLKAVNRLYG